VLVTSQMVVFAKIKQDGVWTRLQGHGGYITFPAHAPDWAVKVTLSFVEGPRGTCMRLQGDGIDGIPTEIVTGESVSRRCYRGGSLSVDATSEVGPCFVQAVLTFTGPGA